MRKFGSFGKYVEYLTHGSTYATFSDKCGSSNFLAYIIPILDIARGPHDPTNLALEAVLRCQGLFCVCSINIYYFRGRESVSDSISTTWRIEYGGLP